MASSVSIPEHGTRQLVVVRLAGRAFGIELTSVREIIPFRRATRLPGTGSHVAGLVNVRGTIVTVIDLRVRLGVGGEAAGATRTDGWVVLVEYGSKLVGAAVDEVIDVRRIDELELGTEADTFVPSGAVQVIGRLDDEVVALLDIRDIIAQVLA